LIDGEAVLIDLDGGRVLGLNETGSFLWPRLPNRTADELVQDLIGNFDVDEAQARKDIAVFISALRERGFIKE
jgi:hypothetical protein